MSLFLLSFFLLGIFFPSYFWNTNQLNSFGKIGGLLIILIAIFVSFSGYWLKSDYLNSSVKNPKTKDLRIPFLILATFIGFLFYAFPMVTDFYGDSMFIMEDTDFIIKDYDNRLISELFTPHILDTKTGVKTYFEMSNFFGWLTQTNGTVVARVLGAIFGGLFAYIWLLFVARYIKVLGWRLILSFLGIVSPLVIVFMGHYETYYYSYTAILMWISCLGLYFKNQRKIWLYVLPVLFVILVKTHITNWLFFPSLVFVYLYHFKEKGIYKPIRMIDALIGKVMKNYKGFFSFKGMLFYVFIPFLVVLLYAYFFIYENHNGPRMFSEEAFENTLFLPLYTDEKPPLDHYNLFSFTHFWDYWQLTFSWSGGVLFLLISFFTFLRKKINWKQPLLLILLTSSILFFVAYFVLNPLLSMPIDWDLFATPGLLFLPLTVIVVSQLQTKINVNYFVGPLTSFALLAGLMVFIHLNPDLLAKKMSPLSQHVFKTYWIGSSTNFINVANLIDDNQEQLDYYNQINKEMKPFAVKGNDKEYANILFKEGMLLKKTFQNNKEAVKVFEEAYEYSPLLGKNLFNLTTTYFELGNYKKAHQYVKDLVYIKYPPYERTLRIGVHISLAAKEYQSAANYAVTYLNRFKNNPTIVEVEQRLRTGGHIETLIELFESGK